MEIDMTDKTRQDSGSTHIIRYALELGLLWIDGDGRDKVREALDALDTLEAQLESIGAGGVSGPPLYAHHSPPEGMVGGWQDIATAPKDGTYLLLWEQYSTNPFVGCWAFGSWSVSHEHVDAEGGWDGAIVVDSISQDRITHWMPLPPPPTTSAGSGKGGEA